MRKTGLRIVETMSWGAHICLFYDRKEDLLETCVAYFKEGLKADEFCIWAVSEPAREEDAKRALRDAIPGFDRYLAKGQFELLSGRDWYLKGDEFDMQRISGGWHKKLTAALRKGYAGMRASGNAFWIESNHWNEFTAYEYELDRALAGKKMIVLCTYPLYASRAVDLMDVARAHHLSLAQRNGRMEFLETPDLKHAKREIERLNYALDVLSRPLLSRYQLTARERAALAQIVRGASSKEAGRVLGISPRTVEFHRANIMRKLGAKNAAELVRKILAD
jgi:DNA-binding CsgD family transcriptional regulator